MANPKQTTLESHEVLLLFRNFALASEGATATADWTASDDMGPDNLLTERLSAPWRSDSIAAWVASAPFDPSTVGIIRARIDLGRPRAINTVSIHRHNVLVPWQVYLYTSPPGFNPTPIAATEWLDPIVRASLEDFDWYDMPWALGPRQEDLDRWQTLFRLDSVALFDRTYYGVRYIDLRFDVSEGSNHGVDYIQAALCFACRSFRPRINMPTGWNLPVIDRSTVRRTQGGAIRGRRRPIHAGFAFSLPFIDRDEAFEKILTGWAKRAGALGIAFAWPEPQQRLRRYFYDTRILGTLTSMPQVAMDHLEWPAATGFVIEETE
jgi:hypothetical protein